MSVAIEIAAILFLVALNGVFAVAEMSIVSARKARLQQRAQDGDAGSAVALELAEDPDDFLSTVQIGITLIGVLAGAFGGATIAGSLAGALGHIAPLAPYSEVISMVIVVLGITYLSLVVGELAPKRYALGNPERIAARMAPAMHFLSRLASPLAHFLSLSAEAVLRIFRVKPSHELSVTEEEIIIMLEEGTDIGVFEPFEEEMVEHVLQLGDRRISSLITPRTEIVWIDVDDTVEEIQGKIASSGHSRFPVAQGSLDDIVGLVLAKDLLTQSLGDDSIDLQPIIRPALFVPEGVRALDVLRQFKQAHAKIALVLDEYGGLQGLVTTADVLVAIVGEIPGIGELADAEAVQREDGSWLIDGMLPLAEFREIFDLDKLPAAGTDTLGGLVMTLLGRIPATGDRFEWGDLDFEVVDMDGRRVDKVLVTHIEPGGGNASVPAQPDR